MSDQSNTVYSADVPEVLEAGEEEALLEAGDSTSELPAPDNTALPSGTDPSDTEEDADSTTPATGQSMTALQGLINRQSSRLDSLRDEMKKLNDSIRSIIENDQELSQIEEQAKAVVQQQKERRQSLANSAESMQIKVKLKELKESVKDLEESLNNHLLNFYQMTGVKFFDADDGSQREFDVRAKLRGKKKVA